MNIPRSKPATLQLVTVNLICTFCGLWATSLLWNPRSLEPGAGNPLALSSAMPQGDGSFMHIHMLTARMEGIPMMAFTLTMLEVILFDRSVEAIRANNKFALFGFTLYTLFFLRIALWYEYANKMAVAINALVNAGLSTFILKCGPNVMEEVVVLENLKSLAAHAKEVLLPQAPHVVTENKTKAT